MAVVLAGGLAVRGNETESVLTRLKTRGFKNLADVDVHETVDQWILPPVLELVYTARDMAPFARECGFDGPSFRWDEDRRFHLRCEPVAAFFHLYGLDRANKEYILDTCPVVAKNEEREFGELRTLPTVIRQSRHLADEFRAGLPERIR